MLTFPPWGQSFVCFATATLFENLVDHGQRDTHHLMLMLKVRLAVTAQSSSTKYKTRLCQQSLKSDDLQKTVCGGTL